MFNFNYYAPTKVIFGKGTEAEAGKLVKAFRGTKALIHYGSGSVVRSGLLERVKASLDAEGIPYAELGGVVPNPRLSLVYEGIGLAKKEGVDFILAIGGGSVIDSAKAIGYGVANEGDVWDYYGRERQAEACLPVGVVLTIAAAGSEMSNSSVITKEEGGLKRGYRNDICRPKFAILDPELTLTLPDYQTACGCTDILMHTMERYFTNGGNMELTDQLAEGLMRTMMEKARVLKENPQDYAARAEVMWAGSLSHNGLTGCGNGGDDFATHGLEHEMGGLYDVAHGAGLAAIWGSWARYVYQDCLPRFYRFAVNVMGVPAGKDEAAVALEGIEAMEEFYRSIQMPTSFAELGITPTEEELADMAHKCSVAAGGKKGSAKVLYEADMLAIYRMAASGKTP
ncbi:MAG: iron-containing alcohol dehydrogenase [Lachnospiraceae bacterium]|jgi:alcohol dehydrogenase YqhD (iron-dependent ADH family)|nr:iron-containing alcohol dehydrogenase [Lachnospiraceae bacterium]